MDVTVPGKSLKDSATRLGDAIAASKAVSDELKQRLTAQRVEPIPIRQEVGGESGSVEQGPA